MTTKKLHKSHINKKLLGVCGGLAESFNIDATIIRLVVAITTVVTNTLWLGFILYLLFAFILPYGEENKVD